MRNLSERELLLKEARMNEVSREIPAIHPRYGAIYKNLYGETTEGKSTLGIRVIVSLVLFALFAALDQGYIVEAPVTSEQIATQIETSFELEFDSLDTSFL